LSAVEAAGETTPPGWATSAVEAGLAGCALDFLLQPLRKPSLLEAVVVLGLTAARHLLVASLLLAAGLEAAQQQAIVELMGRAVVAQQQLRILVAGVEEWVVQQYHPALAVILAADKELLEVPGQDQSTQRML